MERLSMLLISTSVLVLCAGVMLGRVSVRVPNEAVVNPAQMSGPDTRPHDNRDWLNAELKLSPDQQTKMDAIWNQARADTSKSFDERRQLDRQRDDAVLNLLTPEQKAQYQQIVDNYKKQRDELDQNRRKIIDAANM